MDIEHGILTALKEYLALDDKSAAVMAEYAKQTWQPLPRPGLVKYLNVVGFAPNIGVAADILEALCCNPLRIGKSNLTLSAFIEMLSLYPAVPILSQDDFPAASAELEQVLLSGVNSNSRLFRMVQTRTKLEPRHYDVYGYKVILGEVHNLAMPRCTTVSVQRNTNLVYSNYFEDLETLHDFALKSWGQQLFWDRASYLTNTSVEDARSSAQLERDADVIKVALQQATLDSRKSLVCVLQIELRKREKASKS
jgi:hypothetical protein